MNLPARSGEEPREYGWDFGRDATIHQRKIVSGPLNGRDTSHREADRIQTSGDHDNADADPDYAKDVDHFQVVAATTELLERWEGESGRRLTRHLPADFGAMQLLTEGLPEVWFGKTGDTTGAGRHAAAEWEPTGFAPDGLHHDTVGLFPRLRQDPAHRHRGWWPPGIHLAPATDPLRYGAGIVAQVDADRGKRYVRHRVTAPAGAMSDG